MPKLASLSSGLLARKGHARPAMRPQGFGGYHPVAEDLGWNDMGTPAPPVTEVLPPVLVEREALAEQVARPVRPVSVATATRIRKETEQAHRKGAKSAFTLRLDGDRHLRLRLASAIADESAQSLMIEALDALLQSMPEVDALVAALPPAKRR